MTGRGNALPALVVAAAIAVLVATGQRGEHRTDALAYVFAAGFGALLLARRTYPRAMLVVTVLGLLTYHALRYPPTGAAVVVVVALFVIADAGLLWWAVGAAVVVAGGWTGFRLYDGESPFGYQGLATVALVVAAVACGYGACLRRLRSAQSAAIARLTAERADLHDSVAQAMMIISTQAGLAEEKVGRDNLAVLEAVRFVRATSGESLRDVQSVAHQLLADESSPEIPYLAGISSLIESVRDTGMEVSTDIDAGSEDLAPQVETAAFRVVQESLTGVVRHSGASHVFVRARVEDEMLRLTISDDGHDKRTTEDERGHGLAGMRERVRILGGTLEAGPRDGGFTVEARLPVRLDV